MKKLSLLVCMFGTVLLSACGGSSPSTESTAETQSPATQEPPKPVAMAYAQVFDTLNTDKEVIVEGYLQLPNMMFTGGDDAQVDFHARPFQRYGQNIIADITTGNCNNCMTPLGEKYQLTDLKIKADDGTEVLANQRVRLTGKLRVYTSSVGKEEVSASLDVTKIERIPDVVLDYSQFEVVKIGKENLYDTTLDYALSMAEGKIDIPTMLFMENDVTLDMNIAGKRLGVNFFFGTGPNQIESIPANYSKSDFKIHDHAGKLIQLNKPVKVWGTRSTPGKESPGILYVEHIEQ